MTSQSAIFHLTALCTSMGFRIQTYTTVLFITVMCISTLFLFKKDRDVAQSIVGSILLSGPSSSLGYFPFHPVVHNWFIKGRGMYCSVYGKVHIKDPLLLIPCGGSGFPSKKCVNVTI